MKTTERFAALLMLIMVLPTLGFIYAIIRLWKGPSVFYKSYISELKQPLWQFRTFGVPRALALLVVKSRVNRVLWLWHVAAGHVQLRDLYSFSNDP